MQILYVLIFLLGRYIVYEHRFCIEMAQRGHQKYRGKGKKDHGHKRVHKFDADRFVSDMEAAVSGKISANRTFITLYIKK